MEQLLELLLLELGERADVIVDPEHGTQNVHVSGDVDLNAIAALVLGHSAKVIRASVVHRTLDGKVLTPYHIADELDRQAAEARA